MLLLNLPLEVKDKAGKLLYTIDEDIDYISHDCFFKITYNDILQFKDKTLTQIIEQASANVGSELTTDELAVIANDIVIQYTQIEMSFGELTVRGISFSKEEIREDFIEK